MRKLLLGSLLSGAMIAATSTAWAYPMMGGNGGFEPSVEGITQMVEQHLEMRGNKNIKLDSVTEKDGKFVVRITTLDGELVRENVIDPQNQGRPYMQRDPLTKDQAKTIIEGHLTMQGNPNIKLDKIEEKDGKFIAKITTKKGSLVEEITIDPQNPNSSFMGMMNSHRGGDNGMMMGKGMRGKGMMGKGMQGKGMMGQGMQGDGMMGNGMMNQDMMENCMMMMNSQMQSMQKSGSMNSQKMNNMQQPNEAMDTHNEHHKQ